MISNGAAQCEKTDEIFLLQIVRNSRPGLSTGRSQSLTTQYKQAT